MGRWMEDRQQLELAIIGGETSRRLLLVLEFAVIFVVFPVVIYLRWIPNLPIPYLLGVAVFAYFVLRRDQRFEMRSLVRWRWREAGPHFVPILLRDLACLILLALTTRLFYPELLFSLIRRSVGVWAAIMILYPLLSVYPQELLYRAYFFHRYKPLFGDAWGMIVASALAFGFVHIIFGNWLAIAMCVIGGFLFSFTYRNTGSLLLTCLDHAIFGNFLFTIGLGKYFYHGKF
jgi:uncharacterized protein